jgi:transcriptional regulator with XRE-family HTH domain
MPDTHDFGQQIRLRRKALGLTQGELGKQVGMSQSEISLVENNQHEVELTRLRKLARALRTTSDFLLQLEPVS